ncbi:hypothetical protein GCM10009872_10620 [Actinopolymorpha rutila]
MAVPLPADLPTRAERAAWPPPTAGTSLLGPLVEDRPVRPGRRARTSSPAPDQTAHEAPTPVPPLVEPTAPSRPDGVVTPSSETIPANPDANQDTNPDLDLDEHDAALSRLPRSAEHRTHPLPVALSDDTFEPDVEPTTRGGSRGLAGARPTSGDTGSAGAGSSAGKGRRRRTVAPSTPATPAEREPAFSAPGSDADVEETWKPRPAQGQDAEPSWRSVLAQRPEPAQSEFPSPDRPERVTSERDDTQRGTGPATRQPVAGDIPQDLRPRGLRRAEDTEESGSQTVTDIRRQAARPPARPQPDLRGPEDLARSAGRPSTDPREMGMPAFVAALVGVGGSLLGAFLDILVTGGVGLLFSLCFVLTAFGVAAGVRRTGMFTAGVLPPLAALASLVVVAAVDPQRIATTTSPVRAVLAGLAWESWTIVAGCAVALVTIAVRAAFAYRARVSASRRPAEAYATRGAGRRSGSPRRS